ncbi:transcription intermediary factor 1-beta-like [Mytilus edulis]|uniref:transcription intermediary factor 1-beta-like n=1 Tax=Mytilus edulis TaxID=6550 RepID=UPI0039F0215B
MAQSPTSNCEICVQAPGTYNCRQCRQYFCEMCKNAHLRSNISKNHILLKSKELFTEDKVRCEHTEKHTFMCVDCDAPLCKVCLVNDHNGHIMEDLDKILLNLHSQASVILREYGMNYKKKCDHVLKIRDSYTKESENVEKEISDQGEILKSEIDKNVATMITEVRKARQTFLDTFPCNDVCDNALRDLHKMQEKLDKTVQRKENELSLAIVELKNQLCRIEAMKLVAPDVLSIPLVQYLNHPSNQNTTTDLLGTVKYCVMPEPREIILKRDCTGFGFAFISSKNSAGVYVTHILSGQSADHSSLKFFDRIISINGKSVKGLTMSETAELVRNSNDNVKLIICPFL